MSTNELLLEMIVVNYVGGQLLWSYGNMFAFSAVGHGFQLSLGLIKDQRINVCCYSIKHAALRSK